MQSKQNGSGLAARWKIWHQDMFDRESPRRVEMAGEGLFEGLVQLWALHLAERVQPTGLEGFADFNLWWEPKQASMQILGDWQGQVKVKEWVYDLEKTHPGPDFELLRKIAEAHQEQFLKGMTSERILAEAKAALDRQDFENRLDWLVSKDEE